MNEDFTEISLNLAVAESIYALDDVSFDELMSQIFKQNVDTIPNGLKNSIKHQFIVQLKGLIRHLGKKHIFQNVKKRSIEFINNFNNALKSNDLHGLFCGDSNIDKKLKILIEMKGEGNLLKEFGRYFQRLRNRFAPAKAEEEFRIQLEEWFKSGEMTIEIWDCLISWNKNGAQLSKFISLDFPNPTNRDNFYIKTFEAAKKIKTSEFLETEKVKAILQKFLVEPSWDNGNKTIIKGRTIYLSKIIDKLYNYVKNNEVEQVEFYAEDCFHLDSDVFLPGVNFCITSNMAYVWENRKIDLSGISFQSKKSKAKNASNLNENGEKGKDGKPGESSGNLTILVKKMINPSNLTVNLIGGRGEDGQDGGDGFDGPNGIGVTKDEIEELCVKYTSLYWGSWAVFYDYMPPGNWEKKQSELDKSNQYLHQIFTENDSGRKILFSFGGFKNRWFTTMIYDLFFVVIGSDGKKGTSGGTNGIGGEGGYLGNAKIEDPETGERFPVNVVSKLGENGKDGEIGKSGKNGITGNDMVIIDRSVLGGKRSCFGKENTKFTLSYQYESRDYNRFNGFVKYAEKSPACFVRFSTSEIDKTVVTAEKACKRTERTNHSKAVAKQSIISEELLAKTNNYFENESQFLADACEERILAEEAEENQEQQETITEEIVILRQKNEETIKIFTPKGEKKTRSKFTFYSLVERISKTGRHATDGIFFQNMVDLFSIEIPYNYLEKIKLLTFFQKNYTFHAIKDSKLTCAVIAAQQDSLQNGKTYSEIINFADDLTIRRRQKYEFSKFSNETSKIMQEFENIDCQISQKIDETAEILTGVKQILLDLGENTFINEFFGNFLNYKADLQMLKIFNNFLKKIDVDLKSLLNVLCGEFKDSDCEEFEKHLKEISSWNEEKIQDRKLREEDPSNAIALREPEEIELKFNELAEQIHKNSNFWNPIFKSMESKIDCKDFEERYGAIPRIAKQTWTSKLMKIGQFLANDNVDEFIDTSKFVLRIYKDAEQSLIFNRHLYYLNWLMEIEQKKENFENVFVDNGISENYDDFLKQFENLQFDLENVECQEYMNKYGLGCSPTRYLYAQTYQKQVISFVKNGYQQLKKIEQFNIKNAIKTAVFWIDDKKAFGIESDDDYRDLIQAINDCNRNYEEELKNETIKYKNDNFYLSENLKQISSYFDMEYQCVVEEWIENFLAMTRNQKLLSILKIRFFVDGNHLSVFEFQFILLSVAKLQTTFRCPIEFLILTICSVPQNEIINVLVYLQIVFHQSSRFLDDCNIYKALQLVDSVKHKALLVLKLFQYDEIIPAEQFYSLILMLQHANSGAEQLENIEMAEWINIANRQKWSEITGLIRKYGEVGYYLGILDGKGKKEEEKLMRNVFDSVVCIPERLIALVTHFIEDSELVADEAYFENVKKFLTPGNDYIKKFNLPEDTKLPYLMTNESEQDELMDYLMNNCPEDVWIIPENTRSVDDVANLISGIHDKTDEEKENRKNETKYFADLLKIFEFEQQGMYFKNFEILNQAKNLNIAEVLKIADKKLKEKTKEKLQVLLEFDNALYKIKKKRLRHTQKMAILYAVENEKHLLEQVNTGEGKSFIIAAIAIIRRKVDYRFVDIITSSPVLAERDSEEMKPLFCEFKLTVGHNCNENPEERKKSYQCDIVYGDISRFQHDYLLHTFYKKELLGCRTRNCVIVDEVDNMLLDNGNNMLYLSHNIPGLNLLDSLLIFIHAQIHTPMYNGMKKDLDELQASFNDEKIKEAILTDIFGRLTLDDLKKLTSIHTTQKDVESIFDNLVLDEIIDLEGYLLIHKIEDFKHPKDFLVKDEIFRIRFENALKIILNRKREIDLPNHLKPFVKLHLDELIKNCKNSMFLIANEEYVVDMDRTGDESSLEPKVTIIDSNTGVDLATSQWNGGLHQFLQLKHGCRLSPMSLKAVFISNVAYLKGYKRINGLSGTLGSIHESKTLIDLYDADLIKIPTFKPKIFYENVAVVSTKEDEWYQSLFDEVCDQVSAKRSVLIVSESILTVQKINQELKNRYEKLENPSDGIRKCFDTIVTYQREHDEFVFDEKHPLDTSKLIIATNLAGRGTDIKLSKDLIDKGGLHMITSFLPANCRIEEQAFGRAARCGQPGSAQIIALRVDDSGSEQSIFQLKMFRDNQEVHRLASLKSYYYFHTEIEEKCLEKFREHCSAALNHVYSSSGAINEESLPTPSQVVYFELLDKWALWLDTKSSSIDLCAKNQTESEKKSIIDSVQEFLDKHPFGSDETCFEVSKKWIDAPQSLITIGIIQMCHERGFEEAEKTFEKVLKDGYEFAAEVYYYKACMRMKQWQKMRNGLKSMKINISKDYSENLDKAMQFFYKSRTFFTERILKKQKEGKIVAQFSQNLNQANNSGFSLQTEAIIMAYQLIIDNIDWIIGRPINAKMFVTEKISEDYAKKVYESFVRQGVVCPSVINNNKLEKWQFDSLRHVFKLSENNVIKMLEGMKNDARIECYENYNVFNKQIMMAHVKLSHRVGFWTELEQMEVFNRDLNDEEFVDETTISTIQQILVVDPCFESEMPPEFKLLEPKLLSDEDEDMRYQIRLSNGKVQGTIYDWKDVLNFHLQNPENNLIKKVEILISQKKIIKDFIAQINFNNFSQIGYCQRFDGITVSEVTEYFQIDKLAAGWILANLTNFGILKPQNDLFYQFNPDEKIWNEKVGIFLKKEEPHNFDIISEDDSLIEKYAENLDSVRKIQNLKNISPEMIQKSCKIDDNEKLIEFFKLLLKEQILVPYKFTRFRLVEKLDCSCLPSSISNEVLKFLNDRFAYSFAVETLSYALDQSSFNPKVSKQILLPEDPHKDLEKELKRLGIVLPPRICTKDYQLLNAKDYHDFEYFETIIDENRSKLFDETQYHMEFASSTTYFYSREHVMDVETKTIVKNGLLMLIMPKQASSFWKASVKAVKFVGKYSRIIWNSVKAVANAIYSYGASFVRTSVKTIVETLVAVSENVAETVMKGGQSINKMVCKTANAIANNEIYKAANNRVKNTIVFVANKSGITGGATVIANVGNNIGTVIANNVPAGANYIASTKVFQMAENAVNRALDGAKYAYQKMSAYVTACVESYEYYNECRFAARQIAVEQRGLVDEQAILISFNDSMGKQNRKEVNDQRFLKKIGQHLGSESEKFIAKVNEAIKTIVEKEFHNLSIQCPEEDIEALLSTGEGIRRFKTDATEHFAVFQSIAKVAFYQLIREYGVDEQMNLITIPVSSILLIGNYDCDELLEIIRDICDEIKKIAGNNNNSFSQKNLNVAELKQMLMTNLGKQLNLWASNVYIEPTIRIITEFLSNFRNKPQLLSMTDFAKKDCQLKMALTDYNSSKQNKKNSKILRNAFFELLQENLSNQLDNNLLHTVVFKRGYPFPINCAKKLADTAHQVLAHGGSTSGKPQHGQYGTGFVFELFDSNDSTGKCIVSFKTAECAKMQVKMTHINGMIFLCRSDYQSYLEIGELSTEKSEFVLSPFLFEALVGSLKFTQNYFPKQQESFRDSMIHFS